MKLICPKHPNSHKTFDVIAHVSQLWVVDEQRIFLDVVVECDDVLHHPDQDDYYTCHVCGVDAKWVE